MSDKKPLLSVFLQCMLTLRILTAMTNQGLLSNTRPQVQRHALVKPSVAIPSKEPEYSSSDEEEEVRG